MDALFLITVAGVTAFLFALRDSPSAPPIKARLDMARDALREVKLLKQKLYSELKNERDPSRRNAIAIQLSQEKSASIKLYEVYQEIKEKFNHALKRLSCQKKVKEREFERMRSAQEKKLRARQDLSGLFDAIKPHRDELSEIYASIEANEDVYNFHSRIDLAKREKKRIQILIDRQKVHLGKIMALLNF
jgi:hypothetical protein